jgi:hypothetical protein
MTFRPRPLRRILLTEDDRASRWPEPAPVDPASVETAATEPAPSQPQPTEPPPRARLRFRGQVKVNSQAKPPTADRPADPPPVPPAPAR